MTIFFYDIKLNIKLGRSKVIQTYNTLERYGVIKALGEQWNQKLKVI